MMPALNGHAFGTDDAGIGYESSKGQRESEHYEGGRTTCILGAGLNCAARNSRLVSRPTAGHRNSAALATGHDLI